MRRTRQTLFATPSESSPPAVTPASGPVLTSASATLNLPEGWKEDTNGLPNTYSGSAKGGASNGHITLIDLASIPPAYSVDRLARIVMEEIPGAKLTREPDTELDGSPAYHVAGTAPVRGHYEEVGVDDRGRALSIGFSLDDYPPAERAEIIDSVIASFRWKD